MITLTLPSHEETPLPILRQRCRAIYDRRDEVIGELDLETANIYRRQASAIEQFVGNRDGRNDARRAARILECAVGSALGPSVEGRPTKNFSRERSFESIPYNDRTRFRLMYQYRELWEPMLAHTAMSRSQVLRVIDLYRRRQGDIPNEPATIALADWQDWLDEQADCDLLLTDPPYATDVSDIRAFAHDWLPRALRKVRPTGRAYICIGSYPHELHAYLTASAADLELAQVLVWTYRNTLGPAPALDYKQNWQAVLYFRGPEAKPLHAASLVEQFSVQDLNAPDGRLGDRYHAWQKPAALAERFVRHASEPGDLVLDPFAGTGTFLLAAARLGRVAVGCEIDPDQVEVCRERGCVAA